MPKSPRNGLNMWFLEKQNTAMIIIITAAVKNTVIDFKDFEWF